MHLLAGHGADIESVAFHPNGKWVLSASEDKTIKVWSLDTGREVLTLAAFEDSQYLAYLPSGCHTGSADAQRFLRVISKDGKGAERDLPDRTKNSLFLPITSLSALIGN